MTPKDQFALITAKDEIASIQRNGLNDIIGGRINGGAWIAYKWSVERWRKRQDKLRAMQ